MDHAMHMVFQKLELTRKLNVQFWESEYEK